MDNETRNFGSGIIFTEWLGIVFIVLKLCNVITWSWWWVTAPLWGGLALGLAFVIIILFVSLCIKVVKFAIKRVIFKKRNNS